MKAYKCCYNETTKQIDLMEFDIDNMYDFSHDPESNLWGEKEVHNCDYEAACAGVEQYNQDIVKQTMVIIKCKECGIYYPLTNEEEQWFTERDMTPPKRCPDCRQKRKKAKVS